MEIEPCFQCGTPRNTECCEEVLYERATARRMTDELAKYRFSAHPAQNIAKKQQETKCPNKTTMISESNRDIFSAQTLAMEQ